MRVIRDSASPPAPLHTALKGARVERGGLSLQAGVLTSGRVRDCDPPPV